MNAQEFRLGNQILDNGVETHVDIDVLDRHQNNPAFSGIKPIPLTEEWLLKFGFEEVHDKVFRIDVLPYGRITFFAEAGMLCELGQSRGYKLGEPDIKHVHQLQNLFYALTCEELIINQ